MGKGDLWDDSALINAFDDAISKYKTMHGMGGRGRSADEGNAITSKEKNLPVVEADNESLEVLSSVGHVESGNSKNTASKSTEETGDPGNLSLIKEIGDNGNLSQIKEIGDTGSLSPIKETPAVESGSQKNTDLPNVKNAQDDSIWYSQSPEEYNQLLNEYYELENQRQKILQQLNQLSNWSYQPPGSSTFIPEDNHVSVSQSSYPTVTCYCPYGCQSSIALCTALPGQCSDGTCVDRSCDASKGGRNGNSPSQENHDFVKAAMVAAERALTSLRKETPSNAGVFANGGKDRESGPESTKSGTDLAVVLNAWYSAGFYTGKYLSEQSLEKKNG